MPDLLSYRPSDSVVYYRPPRRIYLGRAGVGLALAVTLAAAGGAAYAMVLPTISSLVPRVAAVAVAAAAVAGLAVVPAVAGRVRVPLVSTLLGAGVSVVAVYAMWVVWTYRIVRRFGVPVPMLRLASHPVGLFHLIVRIGEVGTWSRHGEVVQGPDLYLLWMGEAGLMLTAGTLTAARWRYGGAAVCPSCGGRCVSAPGLPRFDSGSEAAVVSAVEGRPFDRLADRLAALPPPPDDDAAEVRLRLESCPKCVQTHLLTVSRVGWVAARSGRRLRTVPVVNQMRLTVDDAAQLAVACDAVSAARSAEQPAE